MHEAAETFSSPKTWRDIPQEVKPRAMSKRGRRRYWGSITKVCLGGILIGATIWGTAEVVSTFEHHPSEVARAAQSVPLRELQLVTDGVLTRDWLTQALMLPRGATLMELELNKLRERLLSHRQVRSAVLTKVFPATLRVELVERSPVARIHVQAAGEPPRTYAVARDGVVYLPEQYAADLMESLPWLEVEKLTRVGGQLAPIQGMDKVNELLAKARYEAEHLYRGFQVVSLLRLAKDQVIEVRTSEIDCVVFSTRDDYFRQLARLDSIRDVLQLPQERPLPRIDLSLGSEVPVAFAPPPVPANMKDRRGAPQPVQAARTQPAPPPANQTTKDGVLLFTNFKRNSPSVREL